MSRRRQAAALPPVADEFGPDDGVDPKELARKPWDSPKQAGRKARQLCGQVQDALHTAFGACGDGVLQALTVVAVDPAPHSGRLRVVVTVGDGGDRRQAADRLAVAAGFLRTEVAAAVNRRKAPELVFEVT